MSQTFEQYEQAGRAAFPVMDGAAADGITVRDYFAAKAMQACRSRNSNYPSWAELATDAYEIADAMLVARTKQPETP